MLTVEQFRTVVEDPDETRIQAILSGASQVDQTMDAQIRAMLD